MIKEKVEAIEKYASERNSEQMAMAEGTADLGLDEEVGKRPVSSPLDDINTGDWSETETPVLDAKGKRKVIQLEQDEIDVKDIKF